MSGVSIGYFDPAMIVGDAVAMTKAIEKTFASKLTASAAFPLYVGNIGKSRVSYALVGGHIPIHRDPVGENDVDGRIFQLVIGVRNRPLLLTAPGTDETNALIAGTTGAWHGIGFGGVELRAGMAVHFDITQTWHGIGCLPGHCDDQYVDRLSGRGRTMLPMAAIIQVSGFDATDIDGAVSAACAMVTADMTVSAKMKG